MPNSLKPAVLSGLFSENPKEVWETLFRAVTYNEEDEFAGFQDSMTDYPHVWMDQTRDEPSYAQSQIVINRRRLARDQSGMSIAPPVDLVAVSKTQKQMMDEEWEKETWVYDPIRLTFVHYPYLYLRPLKAEHPPEPEPS